MSTKYYGYRIENTSVADVLNDIKSKYDNFNAVFKKTFQKNFVKNFYRFSDDAVIKKNGRKQNIHVFGTDVMNIIFNESSEFYDVSLVLFPYNNDVLVMNFSSSCYDDIIKSFNWKDWSYYNNTDKPDDVSDEEWEYREKVWNIVCPDIPANSGLIYKPCFKNYENYACFWKYDDLKIYFDKFNAKKRLEKHIKDYNMSVGMFGKKGDNPWKNIKVTDLIEVNEDNFNDDFNMSYDENDIRLFF